jgi:hypothetical protein
MVQGRSSPVIPTSRVAHRSTKVLTILPSYVVGGEPACRTFSADRAVPRGLFVTGRVGHRCVVGPKRGGEYRLTLDLGP